MRGNQSVWKEFYLMSVGSLCSDTETYSICRQPPISSTAPTPVTTILGKISERSWTRLSLVRTNTTTLSYADLVFLNANANRISKEQRKATEKTKREKWEWTNGVQPRRATTFSIPSRRILANGNVFSWSSLKFSSFSLYAIYSTRRHCGCQPPDSLLEYQFPAASSRSTLGLHPWPYKSILFFHKRPSIDRNAFFVELWQSSDGRNDIRSSRVLTNGLHVTWLEIYSNVYIFFAYISVYTVSFLPISWLSCILDVASCHRKRYSISAVE